LQEQIIHGRFEKGVSVEGRFGLSHNLGKHWAVWSDDLFHCAVHLGVGRDRIIYTDQLVADPGDTRAGEFDIEPANE